MSSSDGVPDIVRGAQIVEKLMADLGITMSKESAMIHALRPSARCMGYDQRRAVVVDEPR
jgi:hypothetical protein